MLDLFDEFRSLIAALDARNIEYALCGGLAMAVHAFPRATIDIELLVRAEDEGAVKGVARALGYALDAAPMSFRGGAVEVRRVTKLDPDSGDALMLDLLLVTPAVEEAWRSRMRLAWEHGTVSVVSKEGLVALKSLRSSGQDLEDIRVLREDDEQQD